MISKSVMMDDSLFNKFNLVCKELDNLDLGDSLKTNWYVFVKSNGIEKGVKVRHLDGKTSNLMIHPLITEKLNNHIFDLLIDFFKQSNLTFKEAGKELLGDTFKLLTCRIELQYTECGMDFPEHVHDTSCLNSSVYIYPYNSEGTHFVKENKTQEWKQNSGVIFTNELHSFKNGSSLSKRFTINTFIQSKV